MQRRGFPYADLEQSFGLVVDAELVRSVMQRVYLWMATAMATTALAALLTVNVGLSDTLVQNPLIYLVAIFAELGLVFYLGARLNRLAPATAITLFFAYSALNGVTLSLILLAYTSGSVVSAFVSTAALFGAMSIFGATTKADLTKFGTYLFMGLIGLLIALLVNLFLRSTGFDLIISVAGVLIFTGLTAYDTQRIGRMSAMVARSGEEAALTRVSLMGALVLYLDFINLMLFILRLAGNRR